MQPGNCTLLQSKYDFSNLLAGLLARKKRRQDGRPVKEFYEIRIQCLLSNKSEICINKGNEVIATA